MPHHEEKLPLEESRQSDEAAEESESEELSDEDLEKVDGGQSISPAGLSPRLQQAPTSD